MIVKLEVVATYMCERLLWILFKLDKKDFYNVQARNSSIVLCLTIVSYWLYKIMSRSINCALMIDLKAFFMQGIL